MFWLFFIYYLLELCKPTERTQNVCSFFNIFETFYYYLIIMTYLQQTLGTSSRYF